jgi:transposase
MANQLSVAEAHSILTLYERGWSCRRIARELGVDRETVGKYVKQARSLEAEGSTLATASAGWEPAAGESKPATALTGSEGIVDLAKPATAPTGCAAQNARVGGSGQIGASHPVMDETGPDAEASGRKAKPPPPLPRSTSDCLPHRELILMKLEQGLSATRIWQDLETGHGEAAPSYHSVRRFVGRLRTARTLPFRRMECAPGAEAQVDFGRGAPVVGPDNRKRLPHVLRVVLSHSRKAYSQAVYRQSTEDFIRCLEDAFWHFGGVPQTLVLDNLKAAVKSADWFDPEINPKVQSFCVHYGIVALPTKPRTPRHKGKVERGVDYVQENGLKGHRFTSLEKENEHLCHWETTVADTRIHGTTRKQVSQVFEQVEQAALRPLPSCRFPFFNEGQRSVHRDGHVEVDKAYYSVPPEHLGRGVWVRWDSRMVRIFDARMQPIATHVRKEAGQFSTQDRHILDEKINSVERGTVWLLEKAGGIGLQAQRWAEAMVQARGIEGVRVLQGLLSLAQKHPHQQLDRACGIALEHEAWRLRTLRRLVQRDLDQLERQQNRPGLLEEHPIIRSLGDYGNFVHQSFLQPVEGKASAQEISS